MTIAHVTVYAHIDCDFWVAAGPREYHTIIFGAVSSYFAGARIYLSADSDRWTTPPVEEIPDEVVKIAMERALCPNT